jgi:MFS family permease
MTLSGLVGHELAPDSMLATLLISAMMLGTLLSTLLASLFMQRFGRRTGFLLGAGLGGALSVLAIANASFWLFCFAGLLLGIYQGFATYYRFDAEPTNETYARLRRQGLDRHESIHAVGAVISEDLYEIMKGNKNPPFEGYKGRLKKLTAKRWEKGKW